MGSIGFVNYARAILFQLTVGVEFDGKPKLSEN